MIILRELNNYSLCSKNLDVLILSKDKQSKVRPNLYTTIIAFYYQISMVTPI